MECNWDVTSDNDWLDFLLKSVIKGTGFPSNYIDESQAVDFARTVIMQNQLLVRKIVSDQETFQKSMTQLIKKLYENEFERTFNSDNNKNKSNTNDNIASFNDILNAIEVVYPTPITLNLTNINEQISNASQAADFIISNYIDENDINDNNINKKKLKMKQKVNRQLLPSLDWDLFDDLYKEVESEIKEETLKEKSKPSNENENNDELDGIDEL